MPPLRTEHGTAQYELLLLLLLPLPREGYSKGIMSHLGRCRRRGRRPRPRRRCCTAPPRTVPRSAARLWEWAQQFLTAAPASTVERTLDSTAAHHWCAMDAAVQEPTGVL